MTVIVQPFAVPPGVPVLMQGDPDSYVIKENTLWNGTNCSPSLPGA